MSKRTATAEPTPTIRVESVPTDSLHKDPANARRHPERNLDAIKASLARFGQQTPIVVDAGNVVRKGNGTLLAALELGWDRIDVVRTPLKGTEATAYAIADNRTGDLAEWDDTALAETLRALQSEDFDLSAVGYRDDEVDALIEGLAREHAGPTETAEDPGAQTDRAEELQAKWKTERGQLWVIPSLTTPGREHRLLCGDSTVAEDVARVMGGEKADMVFTDPPYGYSYESNHYKNGNPFGMLKNDDTNLTYLPAVLPVLSDDCAVYTCAGHQTSHLWRSILDDSLTYKNTVVWKKNNWGMGDLEGAYAGQYEIVFFHHHGRPLLRGERSRDVWEFDRDPPEDHPTQKPTEMIAFAIEKSSDAGDIVLDPFLGSGTTIVAAEQTGRLCHGIELAPAYCAVILERLAGMGLQPRLADSIGRGAA